MIFTPVPKGRQKVAHPFKGGSRIIKTPPESRRDDRTLPVSNGASVDEKSNLNSIFWASDGQPLTILADPQGKILLREQKDLYDLLPTVIPLVKVAR